MSSLLLNQQVKRRSSLLTVLKNRWNLLLVLLPLLLMLLARQLPSVHLSGRPFGEIALPTESATETVLFDYLISEPVTASHAIELHPEVLQELKITLYRVRTGDSLSSIAQRFGLNIDTVISFNDIRQARALRAGTTLKIPNRDGLRYRVRRGDSLIGIASSFGVPLSSLVDWNNLDSDVILPNQDLYIPEARMSTNALNMVLGKLFVYPAKGRLTSRFGYRPNPFTGVREFHNGIDVGNIVGTPVTAAMAGRVARTGYHPGLGRYVILAHPDGFQTLYGHLSRIAVSTGTRVLQGTKIGDMGNTGYSTGPHLHFTIFKNSAPVDPLEYLH